MVEKTRKYVDVNVFVYWLVNSEYTDRAKFWIRKIEESRYGEYCTSTITIYETAVIIAGITDRSLNDEKFVESIVEAFRSLKPLMLIPLEKEDLLKVANLMKKTRLDMEDAIHYLAAKKAKAKTIISNDKDFDKTDLKREF